MDNIQIKRTPPRRNLQSLLDQSAIESSFNYEVQEIRQAYNKTIKDLNLKIKECEKIIEKLKFELREKDNILQEQQDMIRQYQNRIASVVAENSERKKANASLMKKVQAAEYKLQTIQKNRSAIPDQEWQNQEQWERKYDQLKSQNKKQTYKEISQILNIKVSKFVKQIKKHPMAIQLQTSIESFLEDILYINSNQIKTHLFDTNSHVIHQQQLKNRKIGKISQRKHVPYEKLSDMQQWRHMQKSLNKLKSNTPYQQKSEKKTRDKKEFSPSPRPIMNYI